MCWLLFSHAQLIDKSIASLSGILLLICFLRYTIESTKRARQHASWFQAIFHAGVTPVTLDHFPVRNPKFRSAKGAGQRTTATANAVGIIIHCKTSLRIFFQASDRASINTWCILAMHTGRRQIDTRLLSIRISNFFIVCLTVTGVSSS